MGWIICRTFAAKKGERKRQLSELLAGESHEGKMGMGNRGGAEDTCFDSWLPVFAFIVYPAS